MQEHMLTCHICGSNTWVKDSLAGKILGLPMSYNVFACMACGQRHIRPQLTGDELRALYADAYFNSTHAAQAPLQGMKITSSDYISEVAPSRHSQFERTIQRLKQLRAGAVTFLDVGAATGDMVKIALDHGLTAEGIEFSDFAIKKAKELYAIELQQVPIAELDKADYYDLIHLNHVFEHFNEPLLELGHLKRLLKRGGVLYIEVPYQFHWLEKRLYKLRASSTNFTVESLHHPYFYTPKTILRLLRNNDFEIISFTVFDSARYPQDTYIGKLKKYLWTLLSLVSIGNYIQVYARKKSK